MNRLIEDPRCSPDDLSNAIMSDPALTAKVLKLANLPFHGLRQRISSVPYAVSLLGFETVKSVLLSAAVFDMFRVAGTGFDLPALWKHSVATATASKMLAEHVGFANPEKAFTGGLLHDIGKVIIARYLCASLRGVVETVRNEHTSMYDAELKIIGHTHAEFGSWILAKWGLPTGLVEAVEHHHHPTRAMSAFDLASIVYLANIIAHRSQIGSGGDNLMREVDPLVLEYFGLRDRTLCALEERLIGRRIEIESYVTIAAVV
jgi:putative nucleotidyltransferase with HDIG domain